MYNWYCKIAKFRLQVSFTNGINLLLNFAQCYYLYLNHSWIKFVEISMLHNMGSLHYVNIQLMYSLWNISLISQLCAAYMYLFMQCTDMKDLVSRPCIGDINIKWCLYLVFLILCLSSLYPLKTSTVDWASNSWLTHSIPMKYPHQPNAFSNPCKVNWKFAGPVKCFPTLGELSKWVFVSYFCCWALFSCDCMIVWNRLMWIIYPCSSWYLHWHWGNHIIALVPVK